MSEQIGDISLGIFLSLALMSIQLTQIYSLAIPLIIIVLVQVVFMVLFSIFILFKGLGKDYDAAVMVGGFIGHGLGATPNAMANLDVITQKFGNPQSISSSSYCWCFPHRLNRCNYCYEFYSTFQLNINLFIISTSFIIIHYISA